MLYHCRCSKCRGRGTLPKHPYEYKYHPKCKAIGCKGLMNVDAYRQKARTNKAIRAKDRGGKICNDGMCWVHYPHQYKSSVCFYYDGPSPLELYYEDQGY